MLEYRRELLDKIGFDWCMRQTKQKDPNMLPEKWLEMYNEIKEFYLKHGHCRVPFPSRLYKWTVMQRSYYRKGCFLTTKQIDLMNEIHFPWELTDKITPDNEGNTSQSNSNNNNSNGVQDTNFSESKPNTAVENNNDNIITLDNDGSNRSSSHL